MRLIDPFSSTVPVTVHGHASPVITPSTEPGWLEVVVVDVVDSVVVVVVTVVVFTGVDVVVELLVDDDTVECW
jgi:hypothetical protein